MNLEVIMSEEEIAHKLKLLEIYKRRKRERELQMAQMGLNVDPVVRMEMEDLEKEIKRLENDVTVVGSPENQRHVMDSRSLHCPYCSGHITLHSPIAVCNRCNTVIHAECASQLRFQCAVCGDGKLILQPQKIDIIVSGSNAQDVEYVSRSLLAESQIRLTDTRVNEVNLKTFYRLLTDAIGKIRAILRMK